jgi:hypothetical protein
MEYRFAGPGFFLISFAHANPVLQGGVVSKHWLLSAGRDGELWPVFWNHNKVAIGWSAVGNLKGFLTYRELREEVAKQWPERTGQRRTGWGAQIWAFYSRMQVGDIVFVRAHGALVGVAKIVGDYEFLEEENELRKDFYSPYFDDSYPRVREVNWISLWGGMKQRLALTKLTVAKVVNGKPKKVED